MGDKVEELSDMFVSMDVNGDGMLSMEELQNGLKTSGLDEVNDSFAEMMMALDADGSGKIDYSEFVAATMNKKMANSYDSIWKDDLAIVLSDGSLDGFDGVQGDLKNEITQMIQEYDKNNDGVIDFDEFMAMMQESSKNTRNSLAKAPAVKG